MIGEFIGTIKAKHVGKSFTKVFPDSRFLIIREFGRVCLCDVGKRVYMADNFLIMENNEQRDIRLMAKGY